MDKTLTPVLTSFEQRTQLFFGVFWIRRHLLLTFGNWITTGARRVRQKAYFAE